MKQTIKEIAKKSTTLRFIYQKARVFLDLHPVEFKNNYDIILDSENISYINNFQHSRFTAARRILSSRHAELIDIINSFDFLSLIRPVHKDIGLSKKEAQLKENLILKLKDFDIDDPEKCKTLFVAMLYLQPYELPFEILKNIFKSAGGDYLSPIYTYLFNVYCNYIVKNEADRQQEVFSELLSLLLQNIEASSTEEMKLKLLKFSQSYTGSLPMCSNLNMKKVYSTERQLLKLHTDFLYPELKDFKFNPTKNIKEKKRIGILRLNYKGEIKFYNPIFELLDRSKYEIHYISFNLDGKEDFDKTYPNITHHILEPEHLVNNLIYLNKIDFDLILSASSMSGDFMNPIPVLLNYHFAKKVVISCADITTSGIPKVDFFILGRNYFDDSLENEMVEKIVTADGIGFFMPTRTQTSNNRDLSRSKYNFHENETIFISTAHLLKITPELLSSWLTILENTPASKLMLLPFNSKHIKGMFGRRFNRMIQDECKKRNIDLSKRIIISQAEGKDVHFDLLSADVYLDSFPYCSATSASEALNLGIPVITLKNSNYRGKITSGLLQELSLPELVLANTRDYIETGVKLGTSKPYRQKISTALKERINDVSFFNKKRYVKELDRIFIKIIEN